MTTRTDAIKDALTALTTTLTNHHQQTLRLADRAENRATTTSNHGWDGLTTAYTEAAHDLTNTAETLTTVNDSIDQAITCLDHIHHDTALTDVAAHLTTADTHLDPATGTLDAILTNLDTIKTTLETTGEQAITTTLDTLITDTQTTHQQLRAIRADITTELINATTQTGPPPPTTNTPTPDPITTRIEELRRQGHAPQRHGPHITDQQLTDRLLDGIDPATGDNHGGKHLCGRHATKFTSNEAVVHAEKHVRSSKIFEQQRLQSEESNGLLKIRVQIPLRDIFGPDYSRHVHGISRGGSKKHPSGDPPGSKPPTITDFTDGYVVASFRKGDSDEYDLITMYPTAKD